MIYKYFLFNFAQINTHFYETYMLIFVVYIWFCGTYKQVGGHCKKVVTNHMQQQKVGLYEKNNFLYAYIT